MKKICSFLLIFIILSSSCNCKNKVFAYNQKVNYAKALSSCMLYKSIEMIDSYNDMYFYIPESYFVVILESVNANCYKVQYDKFIGYVNSKNVSLVNFTPIVKFLTSVKFDIKETAGTQVWNVPNTKGSVLTTIPAGCKQITYIAQIYGEIPFGGESNVWFYVNYVPYENSTNVYEGYVYNENTTNLDEIIFNAETNAEIETTVIQENISSLNLSSTFKTIIVALISIPIILFFVIILYKIVKKFKKSTNNRNFNKNNNDYFEGNNTFKEIHENNSYSNSNIKSQIDEMRGQVFVKQNKSVASKDTYSGFITYDEDDDLL